MNYPYTGVAAQDLRVTNREDFLKYLAVYDDELNQPINMSGTMLAGITPFTGSNWFIFGIPNLSGFSSGFSSGFGSVATSTTQLTIPIYPIGSQLQAVTLTTQENLNIVPGLQVTIADPTMLNTMTGIVTSYTASSGVLVVQVGWSFDLEIRRGGPRAGDGDDGYVPWYDLGTISNSTAIITASLGNGIMLVDVGIIQIRIPASLMRTLHPSTHRLAMTGTDGTDTRQLLLEPLHVIHGGVIGFTSQVPTNTAFEAIF